MAKLSRPRYYFPGHREPKVGDIVIHRWNEGARPRRVSDFIGHDIITVPLDLGKGKYDRTSATRKEVFCESYTSYAEEMARQSAVPDKAPAEGTQALLPGLTEFNYTEDPAVHHLNRIALAVEVIASCMTKLC